jgi:uncharacterized protein
VTLAEIGNPTYVALKTFRKSGEGVSTPVWVTVGDGKLFVVSERGSGKMKRIANDGRVEVCVADMRGRPKGAWVEAQARIVEDPAEADRALRALRDKYGFQYRLFSRLGRGNLNTVIEVSPRP